MKEKLRGILCPDLRNQQFFLLWGLCSDKKERSILFYLLSLLICISITLSSEVEPCPLPSNGGAPPTAESTHLGSWSGAFLYLSLEENSSKPS